MNRSGSTYPGAVDPLGVAPLLASLNGLLASRETEVEFYFVGGAVIYQAFAHLPATAHIDAMFRSSEVVQTALLEVSTLMAVPEDWVQTSVRAGAYVELSHVRIFVPLAEYVLAVKCAAMRLGDAFREMDDVRYVLRAMNITSADQALSIVTRYFSERQLAPHTRRRLESVLEG